MTRGLTNDFHKLDNVGVIQALHDIDLLHDSFLCYQGAIGRVSPELATGFGYELQGKQLVVVSVHAQLDLAKAATTQTPLKDQVLIQEYQILQECDRSANEIHMAGSRNRV